VRWMPPERFIGGLVVLAVFGLLAWCTPSRSSLEEAAALHHTPVVRQAPEGNQKRPAR
jgi:hypothetical protein